MSQPTLAPRELCSSILVAAQSHLILPLSVLSGALSHFLSLYTHRSDNRRVKLDLGVCFFLLQMQWLNRFLVIGPALCSHLSSVSTAAGFDISPFCLANWIVALLSVPPPWCAPGGSI